MQVERMLNVDDIEPCRRSMVMLHGAEVVHQTLPASYDKLFVG